MFSVFRTSFFLLSAVSAQAGILVLHSESGLQFVTAFSISIGGKEKVLSLGGQPKLAAPINKLPSIKPAGTILLDGDNKALAFYTGEGPQYFISDGLPKTAPADVAAIWRMSHITYKKAANDKVSTEIPLAQFLAFLPGGTDELAHLCTTPKELEFIGGKALATQLEFAAAATKQFGSDPAMTVLEHYVAGAMQQRLDQFESGNAGVEALDDGLQFARLSEAAYPGAADQKQLRQTLADRRKWVDRKRAILMAFAAASEWDAFLLSDHDIERYRAAFPDMAKLHMEALSKSLEIHKVAGEELNKEQEYGAAWREFRLASLRKPSDTVLRLDMRRAWGDYSGQIAKDRQGARKALTAGDRSAIVQDLQVAKNYLDANKPDRALERVTDAETIDGFNLDVLLRKAEVLGRLGRFVQALATLDEYDKRAVDEERGKSEKLRADLDFKLENSLDDLKTEVRKAYAAFNFHQAQEFVKQGLAANPDNPELLIYAGRTAMILRDLKYSRAQLQHYLDVTTNLDASEDDREKVRQLLASVHDSSLPADGAVNWQSGRKSPAGASYDPASGSLQAKVDHINTNNKLTVVFDWDGDRLRTITPTFEKDVHATGEQKIFFGYDGPNSGVSWAGTVNDPRGAAPTDPDELFRRSLVRLSNNPYADPAAIQKLTNQNMALGIAGNRFFDPFVWDKVHFFQLTYDNHGFLKQAREIADPKAAPGDQWLDFEWEGAKLTAVRGYQGPDAMHRSKIYERDIFYKDNHLDSEEVQFQGKTSKVRYVYVGGRLTSATAERDPSLDDRSRTVTFR